MNLLHNWRTLELRSLPFWPLSAKILLLSVIIMVLIASYSLLVIHPRLQHIKFLQTTEIELRKTWKDSQLLGLKIKGLQIRTHQQQQAIYELIQDSDNNNTALSSLWRDIGDFGGEWNLQIKRIQPVGVAPSELSSATKIQIELSGTYNDIIHFLYAIMQHHRHVSLGAFHLQGKNSDRESGIIDLHVSVLLHPIQIQAIPEKSSLVTLSLGSYRWSGLPAIDV